MVCFNHTKKIIQKFSSLNISNFRYAVGRKGQERQPHARAAHPEAGSEHQCG